MTDETDYFRFADNTRTGLEYAIVSVMAMFHQLPSPVRS